MNRPKKKKNVTPASEVLQLLLQNGKSPLAVQFKRWRLWRYWGEVVGEEISTHTDPVAYDKGTLYVWVDHPVRMQEMIFMTKELKKKINSYMGEATWVTRIRFTLDRKSVPKLEETEKGWRDFLSKQPPSEDGEPPHDR
ncbi:MAG: DUF721 domain-containing protein [Bdellovibrionales bacterium]|nr:DUF721 domain-containing protein [Bdellovibrionales bacterium]